jgi:hypothetical protein
MKNTCLAVGMTLEEAIKTAKNYKQEMEKMCKGKRNELYGSKLRKVAS